MIELKLKVGNKSGLHARPASLLVQIASKFSSDIRMIKDNNEVNAKSILGIMGLGAMMGEEITMKIKGLDQDEAADKMLELFNTNFGE